MNAKEMFEKARVQFIREDEKFIIYKDYGTLIRFNKRFKVIEFVVSVPTYKEETDVLQAITQQMKELGWLE